MHIFGFITIGIEERIPDTSILKKMTVSLKPLKRTQNCQLSYFWYFGGSGPCGTRVIKLELSIPGEGGGGVLPNMCPECI